MHSKRMILRPAREAITSMLGLIAIARPHTEIIPIELILYRMKTIGFVSVLIPLLHASLATTGHASDWVVYEGGQGPGQGKHVVFLSGDEEYRSEEGLPMLAKILSQRHGFKCTVLFAVDPDGTINPDNQKSLPGAEKLDTADAIVMLLRFRVYPDDVMKHFADAYERGVPIVGLRTSTHAFNYPRNSPSAYKSYNDFG